MSTPGATGFGSAFPAAVCEIVDESHLFLDIFIVCASGGKLGNGHLTHRRGPCPERKITVFPFVPRNRLLDASLTNADGDQQTQPFYATTVPGGNRSIANLCNRSRGAPTPSARVPALGCGSCLTKPRTQHSTMYLPPIATTSEDGVSASAVLQVVPVDRGPPAKGP